MGLKDGSVEPTEGERQRMENAEGFRNNIKSVERVTITAAVNDRKYGEVSVPSGKTPEWAKEDPSEQGEEKSTKQKYADRYGHLLSDDD
jgi:hypothetical protein